jgi:PhzF family phenazine biosynthesis protein
MAQIFHVDVFSARAFYGNPLAVIMLDAQTQPSTESMQRIAAWLNLSESTFVHPAADGLSYHVRIFTPKQELPFAGHPSIGTAAALFAAGFLRPDVTHYTQNCAAGKLPVWRDHTRWFVRAPKPTLSALDAHAAAQLADICHTPLAESRRTGDTAIKSRRTGDTADESVAMPAVVELGPRWAVAEFASCEALLDAQPDFAALAAWNLAHNNLGLAAFARGVDALGPYLEVRCFVPLDGITEDPVTGSGNAAIAAFLHLNQAFGALPRRYRARQGRAIGRDGQLELIVSEAGEVAVGGVVTPVASGEIELNSVAEATLQMTPLVL